MVYILTLAAADLVDSGDVAAAVDTYETMELKDRVVQYLVHNMPMGHY